MGKILRRVSRVGRRAWGVGKPACGARRCAAAEAVKRALTFPLSTIYTLKQGQAGNAAQYLTRNQALKKLQLKLSEFR